ncbi:MAG: DAK2 domain-containing protein [Tindallia sp. MSAO_Bac2]|nr:MAG: DAK2 domain-containing protein [Tindallia sp. MSAO_Bac2]
MKTQTIDGKLYKNMMIAARQTLLDQQELINALNVFPVPDGDTGTNMSLTLESAIKELQKEESESLDELADAVANGSLMGARGNSGVILSQLFRGFAKGLKNKERVTAREIAIALKSASDTAYQAVMKPTEGTILTVARESADAALLLAETEQDIGKFMKLVIQKANESLERTPELLKVLKDAGVVDSGGKGLVAIMEGALRGLTGEKLESESVKIPEHIDKELHDLVDSDEPQDLEYGYCTEFIIHAANISPESFRERIDAEGDSMLVVGNDELIKVHIHTNHPGKVMEEALKLGSLSDIKIDNMRLQHRHQVLDAKTEKQEKQVKKESQAKDYGMITVVMGEGLSRIMKDFNVDVIIEGGQTMNPSTEDFLNAIKEINADHIFILPNNSNIIMAANQAREITDKNVTVIPSKTIPQGIAAILSFNQDRDPGYNEESMNASIKEVRTGQVTYAVRDTSFKGMTIVKDELIGLSDKEIRSAGKDLQKVATELIDQMTSEEDEILTIYYGEDVSLEEATKLQEILESKYPELEVEVYEGGQPLYYYIFSLE